MCPEVLQGVLERNISVFASTSDITATGQLVQIGHEASFPLALLQLQSCEILMILHVFNCTGGKCETDYITAVYFSSQSLLYLATK